MVVFILYISLQGGWIIYNTEIFLDSSWHICQNLMSPVHTLPLHIASLHKLICIHTDVYMCLFSWKRNRPRPHVSCCACWICLKAVSHVTDMIWGMIWTSGGIHTHDFLCQQAFHYTSSIVWCILHQHTSVRCSRWSEQHLKALGSVAVQYYMCGLAFPAWLFCIWLSLTVCTSRNIFSLEGYCHLAENNHSHQPNVLCAHPASPRSQQQDQWLLQATKTV